MKNVQRFKEYEYIVTCHTALLPSVVRGYGPIWPLSFGVFTPSDTIRMRSREIYMLSESDGIVIKTKEPVITLPDKSHSYGDVGHLGRR